MCEGVLVIGGPHVMLIFVLKYPLYYRTSSERGSPGGKALNFRAIGMSSVGTNPARGTPNLGRFSPSHSLSPQFARLDLATTCAQTWPKVDIIIICTCSKRVEIYGARSMLLISYTGVT